MQTTTQDLVNRYDITLRVNYSFEKKPVDAPVLEDCGTNPDAHFLMLTELNSVQVFIGDRGVEILPKLTDEQKRTIIQRLNYVIV